MKRLFAVLMFALACYPVFAGAKEQTDPQRPNRWRLEYRDRTGISTEAVSVDADGNFLPGDNYQTSLGESTHAWKKLWTANIYVDSGIVNMGEYFVDLQAGTSDEYRVVGFAISTTNVISQTSTYYSADMSTYAPSVPRNIVVYSSAAGIGRTTTTISGNLYVFGIDAQGKANSETIYFSTRTPGELGGMTFSSNSTPAGIGVGNVAWASISSFTISVTSYTQSITDQNYNFIFRIGTGFKIGLTNNLTNASDIYYASELSSPVSYTSLSVDTVNDTVKFNRDPDGINDYVIRHRVRTSVP